MTRPRARLSLKGRALQLLAQRDQSRVELRIKLLRHVAADPEVEAELGRAEVEALLDWLEANRYLSAERFAESRVHARATRFGNRRIQAELAQHGVALAPEVAQALSESELQRAAAVRERRFPAPPRDASERAAQARFLAGRGFSAEVIQRVLRQLSDFRALPS
jgi:regulatory protein